MLFVTRYVMKMKIYCCSHLLLLVINCDELKMDLLILLQASSHFSKFGSQKMKSISNQLANSFIFGKENVLVNSNEFFAFMKNLI